MTDILEIIIQIGEGNLSDEDKRRLNSAAYNGGLFRLEKGNWDIESMAAETTGYVDSLKVSDYPDSVKTN